MGRRVWTEEEREAALALYAEHGAAEASRRTGVPDGTIKSWAARLDRNAEARAKNRDGLAAAVERRKRSLEERRAVLVEKLGELAEMGVDWASRALEQGMEGMTMREVVGVFTRAVHDLQLLSGGATSRAELTDRDEVLGMRDELAQRREAKAS